MMDTYAIAEIIRKRTKFDAIKYGPGPGNPVREASWYIRTDGLIDDLADYFASLPPEPYDRESFIRKARGDNAT